MPDSEQPLCPHCCTPYTIGADLCDRCGEPVGVHAVNYYDTPAGQGRPRPWARDGLRLWFLLCAVLLLVLPLLLYLQ
jgi:predicted amidophosphoribosyltransferase